MLKKELITIASEEAPHVILTVGRISVMGRASYGWQGSDPQPYGSISRIPVWGDTSLTLLSTKPKTSNTSCSVAGQALNISIRRLDTGYEIKIALTNKGGGIAAGYTTGLLFAETDNGKTVPLVFDPPPTSYL